MGIATRFIRLCKADIHGVMDHMEDKGLLLKQCLRDMEEELDSKEARLAALNISRQDAKREQERLEREAEKLEQDLDLALDKDKDDIAKMLLRKLKPLRSHLDEFSVHAMEIEQEQAALKEELTAQQHEYDRLKLKAGRHFHEAEQERFRSERGTAPMAYADFADDSEEAEIELELLQRKEARSGKTGSAKGGKAS